MVAEYGIVLFFVLLVVFFLVFRWRLRIFFFSSLVLSLIFSYTIMSFVCPVWEFGCTMSYVIAYVTIFFITCLTVIIYVLYKGFTDVETGICHDDRYILGYETNSGDICPGCHNVDI